MLVIVHPYLAELVVALERLPALERARVAHVLLTDGRGVLAAVRRAAIVEEVQSRGRGGLQQVAGELGISRQKIGEAMAEHRRSEQA